MEDGRTISNTREYSRKNRSFWNNEDQNRIMKRK